MVRLKVRYGLLAQQYIIRFQFLDGAIKRIYELLNEFGFRGFNSLMVRLKVQASSCAAFMMRCFNSLMVRLKAACRGFNAISKASFNSLMVRLKGNRGATVITGDVCFNSLMVRLKVTHPAWSSMSIVVSIP